MSDALSDIARDERRAKELEKYLSALLDYLKNQIDENFLKVKQAAENVDSVGRGYWRGSTNFAKTLKEDVEALLKGDKKEWINILMIVKDLSYYSLFKKFLESSPFKDRILILVS